MGTMTMNIENITKDEVRSLVPAIIKKHIRDIEARNTGGTRLSPYQRMHCTAFYKLLLEEGDWASTPPSKREKFVRFAEEVLWELVSRGWLVPMGHRRGDLETPTEAPGLYVCWTSEALEDFSQDVHVSPYDSTSYLRHLNSFSPKLDTTTMQAMAEAVRAFNARCYASAAVMYGVAAESVLLRVFDSLVRSLSDTGQQSKLEKFSSKSVLHKLREMDIIFPLLSKNAPPLESAPLKDAWEFGLGDLSNVIRQQRNAAGHPELRGNFTQGLVLGLLAAAPHHLDLLSRLEAYLSGASLKY